MSNPFLYIEMDLWLLHPLEPDVPEERYAKALSSSLTLLESMPEKRVKALHAQLLLLVAQDDRQKIYETLSAFVGIELYAKDFNK